MIYSDVQDDLFVTSIYVIYRAHAYAVLVFLIHEDKEDN